MGGELFEAYPELIAAADDILGFSIERLCLEDPDGVLASTRFTQPALYVTGALAWRALCDRGDPAAAAGVLMGHSLGEYNALHAAGVFDFETGLRLVKARGELMAATGNGAMAAVLGASLDRVREIVAAEGLAAVDVSSVNTPTQTVLAGTPEDISRAVQAFGAQGLRAVALKVSGAFHSRYMAGARDRFAKVLSEVAFAAPKRTVIANATGLPHVPNEIASALAVQLTSPVQWLDGVRYALRSGSTKFVELGGTILNSMVSEIRSFDSSNGPP
jgi:malonyl CoA-acyl carrier protein transacylase